MKRVWLLSFFAVFGLACQIPASPDSARPLPLPKRSAQDRAQEVCGTADDLYIDTHYGAALNAYAQATRICPTFAYAYFGQGAALVFLGDQKRAIRSFAQAIRLNPRFPEAYHARGVVYDVLGEDKKAISDYTQAIRLSKFETVEGTICDAYCHRGEVRYRVGDKAGAVEDCDKAVQTDPNQPGLYSVRARLRFLLGDRTGAVEDDTRAVALFPAFADAYAYRGYVRLRLKDYQGAIGDYNRAIAADPSLRHEFQCQFGDYHRHLSGYYDGRGYVFMALGKNQAALLDFNQALRLNASNVDAYDQRGDLYSARGDSREALSDYGKALLLYRKQKNPSEAAIVEAKIENLRTK